MRAERDIAAVAARLAGGGVALLATDTLPGLHASAALPAAVARLVALKGRREPKPLLVLCATPEQAFGLAAPLTPRVEAYARRCWPGPFTLILPGGASLPPAVTAGRGSVACRVPALPELRDLIALVGAPLVSTSANLAGEEPCATLDEAARRFGDRVDAVGPAWTAGAASSRGLAPGQASALADLTAWPPELLRAGPQSLPDWAADDP